MDATEESKDGEEALSDAKSDASDINDTGSELIEVGGSTQLGKKTAAQIRAMQAKARVFMRIFARKAKVLQRILVARMQVRSVFNINLYGCHFLLTFSLFFTHVLSCSASCFLSPHFSFLLPNFSSPNTHTHTGPGGNFCFDHVVTESPTISS